ncbi:MAG TPA: 3-phosphoshikimate 1-carboxyvinyltransferase [Candidatus Limnocylindrales bacterium]|nr:3-phosphoshikimate 1-carboxyvinyltransferase [Candidatus Limnocylindrales bacterium]
MTGSHLAGAARGPLRGRVRVPGDKSIGHRALMFNAVAEGEALVRGLPRGQDVLSTMAAMQRLGAAIERIDADAVRVRGRAMKLARGSIEIDCQNSGTTMRLLCGLLAGQEGLTARLSGDGSLSRRPMRRVAEPLARLGGLVETTDGHAPLTVQGRALRGADVVLPVASAQLKSAVLLAGLQAAGTTGVTEPEKTRDHTENMLAAMGVAVRTSGVRVSVDGPVVPSACDVTVAGDPSSAAFLLAAAVLIAGSEVTVEEVCLNPTRTGFLDVLQRMGADITATVTGTQGGESVGTLRARASALRPFQITAPEVPACIDELPLLCVAAAFADGTSVLSGASELRVKESDRIATTAALLRTLGVQVEEREDGMIIHGQPAHLRVQSEGGAIATRGDHRIAMAATVGAAAAGCPLMLDDAGAVAVSFPEFFSSLERLGA